MVNAAPNRAHGERPVEWPTVAVAAVIYATFALLTWFHASVPWWVAAGMGGYLVAWHGSLQHEVVHGHPTGVPVLNLALVAPALGLWLPFEIYRRSHLAHHRAPVIADPALDPEASYARPAGAVARTPALRALASVHNTLAGRLLLGPAVLVAGTLADSVRRIVAGQTWVLRAWLMHLLGCALVLAWILGVCEMRLSVYLAVFVYPGIALTLLRSYAEHEASAESGSRTAVVEAGRPLGLLYLNNNLHVTHHAHPACPWYRLPTLWMGQRDRFRKRHPTSYTAATQVSSGTTS